MEFQYRAGDHRSRSPPPKTGAAAASSASEIPTVAFGGGDATGDHGENRAVVSRPPPPAAAAAASEADSDELRRRQAAKDKIRERILRDEAEHWALEAEVRRELMQQLFPLMRRGLRPPTGARAEGPDATAAAADSPSLEANLKADASASLPAKRKTPDVIAESAVLAVASTKKQKSAGSEGLACMVCGIKATSMRNMQEHLMGKAHKRKAAAALAHPRFPEAEQDEEAAAALSLHTGGYTPNKFTMLTNAGAMNVVLQMDGYLLCEVCNVRATDRITMMCHLQGRKHILKAQKQCQAGKPSVVAAAAAAKKDMDGGSATLEKKVHAPAVSIMDGYSETMVIHVDEVQHVVQLIDGVLFCDRCNVWAPSEVIMRSHLIGKKHKKKANKLTTASIGSRGKEAAIALSEVKSDEAASVNPGMGHTQVNGQATEGMEPTMMQEDTPCDSISTAPIEAIELANIEDDSSIAEESHCT